MPPSFFPLGWMRETGAFYASKHGMIIGWDLDNR